MLFLTAIGVLMMASASYQQKTYTIQSGDTYCKIALQYGCPNWQILADANPSQTERGLQVGATLTIPSTCGSKNCVSTYYGDSYQTIAQRYSIDVNCLADYNCGQPISGSVCLPSNCQAYGSSLASYKIASGDTYCAISQKLGCPSWQTLANANPSQAERGLQIGSTLIVPSNCTGKSNCISPSYGDNYNTIAQRYNMDVNCLMDYNCNATFSSNICLPSNCPAYYAPTTPAPLNGWVGNTFYCNGVATNNLSQTCGGIMYYNGNAVTGIVGSTFFCNGVSISSPPPQQYTCNGMLYYGGLIANGYPYSGSQFYCNGYPVNGNTVATTSMTCGGKLYSNGKLFTGFDNGSFYCDGVENLTGSGVCGGYYWNNYKQVHTCTKTKSQANQTCQDYINNYNNGATLQNILDCNPQFTATNCPLATGSIFYF